MAVFLLNICKFNGCGKEFQSLRDLIHHIEDTHIDYDPVVIEQKEQSQPACLPLSYVLRFITDAARKESPFLANTGVEMKRKLAIKHHSYSMSSSNRSNTPTGSEMDDDELMVSESEDSNDSWTTEEFSSEFIMRYGSRSSAGLNGSSNEKPFACPVPGCKKRYKNVNGIKYHSKNGHKKDGKLNRIRKGFKCHCGKSYKSAQGLKSHTMFAHSNSQSDLSLNSLASSGTPSSSSSSLSSAQQLHTPDTSTSSTTSSLLQEHNLAASAIQQNSLKNSISLVTIKSKPSSHSDDKKDAKNSLGAPMSKYDNLGILTPATSPKLQQLQQQQLSDNQSGTVENLPLTPVSPVSSQLKKFQSDET